MMLLHEVEDLLIANIVEFTLLPETYLLKTLYICLICMAY